MSNSKSFLKITLVSALFLTVGAVLGLVLNYQTLRELRSGNAPDSSSQLEENEEEAAPKIATYSGTLKPLGQSIYMQGSHFLENEAGEMVILLEGGKVTPEFLQLLEGQTIEVEGVVEDAVEGGQKVLRIERIVL